LTLGAATVLYRVVPELVAQDLEQRRAVVFDTDLIAVDDE
jgi:hypothetical protein